jgi:hypothetical protein
MKYLPKVLVLTLLAGVIFAFATLYGEFRYFYDLEGTIWKFQDCATTNPFLTPCFFGAIAFVIALVWSAVNAFRFTGEKQTRHYKYLSFLLAGGTLFAWGNFAITVVKYYQGAGSIACGAVPIEHPLQSSCFVGALLYTAAFTVCLFIRKKLQK